LTHFLYIIVLFLSKYSYSILSYNHILRVSDSWISYRVYTESFGRNKNLFKCFIYIMENSCFLTTLDSFFLSILFCVTSIVHRLSYVMFPPFSTLPQLFCTLVPNHRFCVTENRQRISIYYTLSRLCLFFIHLSVQLQIVRCVMRDREAKIKTPAMSEYTVT
jgi:hypothetical protein